MTPVLTPEGPAMGDLDRDLCATSVDCAGRSPNFALDLGLPLVAIVPTPSRCFRGMTVNLEHIQIVR